MALNECFALEKNQIIKKIKIATPKFQRRKIQIYYPAVKS